MTARTLIPKFDFERHADPEALERLLKASLNPGSARDPHGDPEGIVGHPDDLEGIHASLHILAKDVMEKLANRYPGFLWGVQPKKGGVINVFCLNFSGQWGYVINIDDIQNDPRRAEAMRAGGEILKRFGVTYNGLKDPAGFIASVPRNGRGEAIPDVSDLKQDRFTTAAKVEKAMAEGRTRVVGHQANGDVVIEVRS